jgi:hypothetical protein
MEGQSQTKRFSRLQVLSLFLCGTALLVYKSPFAGGDSQNVSELGKAQEDTFKP